MIHTVHLFVKKHVEIEQYGLQNTQQNKIGKKKKKSDLFVSYVASHEAVRS